MQLPRGLFIPFVDACWLKKQYDTLLNKKYRIYANFASFCNDYTDENALVIQGSGFVLRFLGINSGHYTEVHGYVNSSGIYRCVGSLRELSYFILQNYNLRRIEVSVPTFLRGVNRLIEKVGFTLEGTLRNRGRSGNIIYDENVYSLVR